MNFLKKEQMPDVIKKILNRETIAYLIAGVLTTILNIIAYYIICNILHVPNLIANATAWVISVIFAYFINDRYVFQSEKLDFMGEFMKIIKFIAARLFSFAVEEGGMFLFIDVLSYPNLIIKIIMNVIVVILNYIFSKIYIFK